MFGVESKVFNYWSMSHFFFTMILAYVYPEQIYLIFFLTLFWELFEYVVQEDKFNDWFIIKEIKKMSKCR